MNMKISAVDLFCGVGGLTHGLVKSGIPVMAGIDNDISCQYSFEKNNESVFIHKEIQKVSASSINRLFPEKSIKVLVACAPCQPFSKHTQKMKSRKENEKWGLLYHFTRIIKGVRPTIISMENVPQIIKHKVFRDFVNELETLKYHVAWKIVHCPDYRIPQNRRRLVLLASKLGEINLIDPTQKPDNYKTVKDIIGKLPRIQDGKPCDKDPLHRTYKLSSLNKQRIKQSKAGGSWKDWDKKLRTDCHQKKTGATYSSVYGRMRWDEPSPTITTQFYSFGTGRFGHPRQNRAISLREGALLQTFPKSYKFYERISDINFKKLGRHIGNAVPVQLGKIIGRSINAHIRENT
ncbi:MAG: DNA (cytosine-5-)-methyltransferase [bacterium]|nr:DNA (cytosine-5-)-methyltransferase [bacterium]